MKRKRFLVASSIAVAAAASSSGVRAANEHAPMTAAEALPLLVEGNRRFVSGNVGSHRYIDRVATLASGQHPFAAVLGCADSRVPVETVFDRAPGDIFVVRVAGNFVSEEGLASLEYAVAVLKVPLLFVLGHTACGAVKAAMDYVKSGTRLPGHMQSLADALAPAAQRSRNTQGDWWHDAVVENVRMNRDRLRASTPILHDAVGKMGVEVHGGVYDLARGTVTLL